LVFHVYPNAFQPEGGIIIESFRYQGHNLSYSIEGIDSTILRVDMIAGQGPGPIEPDDVVRVEIEFQVLIPEKADRFGWFYDDTPAELLVYNFGNWYPIAAVYDDRGWHTAPYTFNSETFYSEVAMYNVSLTVPTEFILAATGELQTTSQEIDERTWVWSAGPSHDFAWVASPDFLTESIVVDGMTITSYYTTEHSGTGSQALSIAADALQVYENLFGPYPWESFRIVETISSVSMEYPQLVMITTPSYETPAVLERFIAHEVAHQWVPFAIGVDSFSEPWIDEGFATYGEFCYYEYVYDNATRQSHRESLLASYFAHVFDWGDDSLNHSMDYWVVASGYGAIVYEKAALVFDMLRYQIGNDAFYNAWQQIYLEFLHKNLRAGDLIQIFENTVGASLDWFFDHWINEEGIVTLNFVEASAYLDGTEWTLDFELNQTGDVQLSIWVPVRVNYTVGSELLWVWLPTLSNSLHTVSVDFTPVTLELDPDSLLLCRYGVSIVDVTI
ncbi:MAG: M1 family metallopeptidase, partial [Candidatus Thorarchaeota archaeon]